MPGMSSHRRVGLLATTAALVITGFAIAAARTTAEPGDGVSLKTQGETNSQLKGMDESEAEGYDARLTSEARERVANWLAGSDDPAVLTAAILALPRYEDAGLPAVGPPATVSASGRRATLVVAGTVQAVTADSSGLLHVAVHPNRYVKGPDPDAATVTITLRAVIESSPRGIYLGITRGETIPPAAGATVVYVADGFANDEIPQPAAGMYVVNSDSNVSPQPGNPFATDVSGVPVERLLALLGG